MLGRAVAEEKKQHTPDLVRLQHGEKLNSQEQQLLYENVSKCLKVSEMCLARNENV